MKRSTLTFALAIAMGILTAGQSNVSRADDVDLRQLLHGPERCDHVISLLLRHGVNNDSVQDASVPPQALLGHPTNAIQMSGADIGDLELISVARRAETTTGCGPTFDVVVKNCSTRDVCHSRLTLVGLLGRIHGASPNTTVKVESLPAGQAVQISVTLPIESLAMGNLNGQILGFNRVLVVVDSFDQFMESNEANNLRTFDLSTIPIATVAPVAVLETSESNGMPDTAPAIDSVVNPPVAPQPNTAPQSADANASAAPAVTSNDSDLRSAIDQFASKGE